MNLGSRSRVRVSVQRLARSRALAVRPRVADNHQESKQYFADILQLSAYALCPVFVSHFVFKTVRSVVNLHNREGCQTVVPKEGICTSL
jgi:hypothetical protein